MSWDPGVYEAFGADRAQPFLDLMKRLPKRSYARIVDLGCGTGEHAARLAAVYPAAHVLGVDSSAAMLREARARHPAIAFEQADVAAWWSGETFDLVISNAALHWIPNHPALLARLTGLVAPGGVLAFQVPANHDAPSHRAVADVAADARWADRALSALPPGSVLTLDEYRRGMDALSWEVEAWDVVYEHRLEGVSGLISWLSGTTLHALLPRLDVDERALFVEQLSGRLQAAYGDGARLRYPFRRRFVAAAKPTS